MAVISLEALEESPESNVRFCLRYSLGCGTVAKRTFRFGREACALVLKADLFERADSALSMRAY